MVNIIGFKMDLNLELNLDLKIACFESLFSLLSNFGPISQLFLSILVIFMSFNQIIDHIKLAKKELKIGAMTKFLKGGGDLLTLILVWKIENGNFCWDEKLGSSCNKNFQVSHGAKMVFIFKKNYEGFLGQKEEEWRRGSNEKGDSEQKTRTWSTVLFYCKDCSNKKLKKSPKNFYEASKNTRENVTFLSPYNMRHHNHKKILKHCGLNLKRGENNNRNEGRWSLYSLLALAEKSQSFACRRMHLGGPLVTGDNQTPGTDSYYRQFNWETPFNYSKELNHLKKFAK